MARRRGGFAGIVADVTGGFGRTTGGVSGTTRRRRRPAGSRSIYFADEMDDGPRGQRGETGPAGTPLELQRRRQIHEAHKFRAGVKEGREESARSRKFQGGQAGSSRAAQAKLAWQKSHPGQDLTPAISARFDRAYGGGGGGAKTAAERRLGRHMKTQRVLAESRVRQAKYNVGKEKQMRQTDAQPRANIVASPQPVVPQAQAPVVQMAAQPVPQPMPEGQAVAAILAGRTLDDVYGPERAANLRRLVELESRPGVDRGWREAMDQRLMSQGANPSAIDVAHYAGGGAPGLRTRLDPRASQVYDAPPPPAMAQPAAQQPDPYAPMTVTGYQDAFGGQGGGAAGMALDSDQRMQGAEERLKAAQDQLLQMAGAGGGATTAGVPAFGRNPMEQAQADALRRRQMLQDTVNFVPTVRMYLTKDGPGDPAQVARTLGAKLQSLAPQDRQTFASSVLMGALQENQNVDPLRHQALQAAIQPFISGQATPGATPAGPTGQAPPMAPGPTSQPTAAPPPAGSPGERAATATRDWQPGLANTAESLVSTIVGDPRFNQWLETRMLSQGMTPEQLTAEVLGIVQKSPQYKGVLTPITRMWSPGLGQPTINVTDDPAATPQDVAEAVRKVVLNAWATHWQGIGR